MSALTITRRGATAAEIDQIVLRIKHLRAEGPDACKILDALHDAVDGSAYQAYGSVDLDDISGRMGREIMDFCPAEQAWAEAEDLRAAA